MKKMSAAPAWLNLNENRTEFVLVPEKAQIIRRLFQETAQGIGAYAIAKRLNGERIPTIGPSPRWLPSSISKILENRAVTGEFQPMSRKGGGPRRPSGAPVQAYYPRVIEDELFAEAERVRVSNISNNRGRKGSVFTNVFTGLLFCAGCSAGMKFFTHDTNRRFGCRTYERNHSCVSCRWEYQTFEEMLLPNLRSCLELEIEEVGHSAGDKYAQRAATNLLLKKEIQRLLVSPVLTTSDVGIQKIETEVTVEMWTSKNFTVRFPATFA